MGVKSTVLTEHRIERIPFSTRIDRDLIRRLKIVSAQKQRDVYELVEEALEKIIKENEIK
jgi:hypothetical protein